MSKTDRFVVSLSSGISSAIAAHRTMQRYGKDAVDLVFMDTLWEDDDNYRFLLELEQFWGKPITRIVEGRTPLEVAEQEHIIPTQKIAPCTHRLKIEPFLEYLGELKDYYRVTVVLGMNWTEPHRMEAPRKNYAARGYDVLYPLMWKPYDYHPMQTVRGWGIEPPRMYRMGYTHANCGGRCVKQGKGDWQRTRINFPARFEEVARWEHGMRQDERFADYAIVRDFRGGEMKPIALYDLAEQQHEDSPMSDGQLTLWGGDESACFCSAGDPGPCGDDDA